MLGIMVGGLFKERLWDIEEIICSIPDERSTEAIQNEECIFNLINNGVTVSS